MTAISRRWNDRTSFVSMDHFRIWDLCVDLTFMEGEIA